MKKKKPPLVLQHERRRGRMILRSIIPALILPQAQQKRHRFFRYCETGAENGVALRELVAMTGMNERLVRLKIQQERKAGKLILSNNRDGYFLPECPEDVRRFARSMSRRAAEIAGVARAASATALADMTGRECLEGWM
ncbi:MAG: hypothetical protein ACLR8U_04710 [Oscillospiraceae bacterium]